MGQRRVRRMPFKKSSAAEPLPDDPQLEAEPTDSSRVVAAAVEAPVVSELSAKAAALIRVARAGLKPSLGERRRVSAALGLDLDLEPSFDAKSPVPEAPAVRPRRRRRKRPH